MKRVLIASAAIALGLTTIVASACGLDGASSASATPAPAVQTSAAVKAPATVAAKTTPVKPVASEKAGVKTASAPAKVATASPN